MLSDPTPTPTTAGEMPDIVTRRGFPGIIRDGRWMPLPVMGGDGTEDDPPAGDPPGDPPAGDNADNTDAAKLQDLVRKLRLELKDAKSASKEAETLRAKLKEIEDAQLSEAEKAAKERDEAKAQLADAERKAQERVIRSEVRVVASELGFADPFDAFAFIDASAITFDDDGEPQNVKTLLEKLAKDKPYLLKAESGKAGVPPTPKGGGSKPTRDDLIKQKIEALKNSGSYTRL